MKNLLDFAKSLGFNGCAVVETTQIPFDQTLVKYCQENVCGRYGANYSCPPHCGTFDQMQQKILNCKQAVVVQSVFDGVSFDDKQAVALAKNTHNARLQQLLAFACANGSNAFVVGATGCEKCSPCALMLDQPCKYPDQVFSCTSAYSIDVAKLTRICNLSYEWQNGKIFLYGLLLVA